MSIAIILPTQLFADISPLKAANMVYLYEHPLYFTSYKFHKYKLILHRATMKRYADYLLESDIKVKYLEYDYDIEEVFEEHNNIWMYDPVDKEVAMEFAEYAAENDAKLTIAETPAFLTDRSHMKQYHTENKTFHLTPFYIWQRKRLHIMVDNKDKPEGGKWTYDTENRSAYPKSAKPDDLRITENKSPYVAEAVKYVRRHFSANIGSLDGFYLSIDFDSAKKHLSEFTKGRLDDFGKYQDAVSKDVIVGNHSMISALLNIGLLTPKQCVDKILSKKRASNVASVEGIIRQIIGWRELVRYTYEYNSVADFAQNQQQNHFKHKRKLNDSWYNATTGIAPIDYMINKVIKYAYLHHIERLMFVGNFMLLTETSPKDVYDWFMIMSIDSYHWVMEPNVYAMTQYVSPIMMTRPYFSSSNYIDKMSSGCFSDKSKHDWREIWDALYYRFVSKNEKEFSANYATASAVAHWRKKDKKDKERLMKIANDYLIGYKF